MINVTIISQRPLVLAIFLNDELIDFIAIDDYCDDPAATPIFYGDSFIGIIKVKFISHSPVTIKVELDDDLIDIIVIEDILGA
ncbi:MAG: hypothetical protein AAGG75_18935 [Bacteroidota bacterium]